MSPQKYQLPKSTTDSFLQIKKLSLNSNERSKTLPSVENDFVH
ncbi:hypothetical protein LEP1GSC195_1674 [Leptospira wolbachii serovar Codice str. CDC]|uniref:Uncharacterized protein n=1 Tax=Leptospira wolbachii serovar Codice str. CDC TaxID=1218599 RepID=R9A131_9LEPT|nr:hypothetical protein LEP1GSC195_1674 [Leptospira wolbachii serovar Codice str. CDC]